MWANPSGFSEATFVAANLTSPHGSLVRQFTTFLKGQFELIVQIYWQFNRPMRMIARDLLQAAAVGQLKFIDMS
jgi:hypothetical protein